MVMKMKFNARNNIYTNWNKPMYIATKKEVVIDDYGNEIVKYNEPFFFGKINYQPLTTKQMEAFIRQYGQVSTNIVSCLIDYKEKGKFGNFDLAYLYDATPEGEIEYGDNANYKVRAYKPQNTKIMVILEEIIKEDNNGEG